MHLRLTLCALLLAGALPAHADIIEIGSGAKTAYLTLVLDDSAPGFTDPDTHLFIIDFDGTLTGEELLKTALPTFVTYLSTDAPPPPPLPAGDSMRLQFFDFDGDGAFTDAFLNAVSFKGKTSITDTDFDPSFTYYTRDSVAASFVSSPVGMSSRTVDDGYHDAYVFGTFGATPPPAAVPEPGSLALLLPLAGWAVRRRRQQLAEATEADAA